LEIDTAIFPMRLTSETVATLLRYSRANNVKRFDRTPFRLISVRAGSMRGVRRLGGDTALIVAAVERDEKLIVPADGEVEVAPNDLVYLYGDEKAIRALCNELEHDVPATIRRCVIFGAGELGVSVARRLLDEGIEVKLLEKDTSLWIAT